MTEFDQRLLPCPFCGGKAELVQVGVEKWDVGCYDLDCPVFGVSSAYKGSDAIERAIKDWNTRA